MNLSTRLLIIIAVEIVYMVATRVAIYYLTAASLEAELIRTALRIATALIYWQLMKPFILSKTPELRSVGDPYLFAGLLLFFSIPVLVGTYSLPPDVALLFAFTSIAVAIKEEFLFRGILQNLIERKWGAMFSIIVTSAIFTAWHIGVMELSLWVFSQIFLASILLGLVYVRSGSILLVVVLHAVYDAVFSFTPILGLPLNQNFGYVPLLAAVAFVLFWAWFGEGGYYLKATAHDSQKSE